MKTFISERILEEFYSAVARNDNNFLYSVHLPHSSVFYVREALFQKTGKRYTLDYIEWALIKEGMINPRLCHNWKEKISWDKYPLQKETK